MATTDFNVNLDDLAFILRNIKIAEAHSGGMTLTEAIQAAYGVDANDANLLPAGLRTVSGAYNNLFPGNETLGAADTPFPRITDPAFVTDAQGSIDFDGPGPAEALSQGNYAQSGTVIDSAPRLISNLIVNQTVDNPAAIAAWFSNPLALDAFHARYGDNAIAIDPKKAVVAIADASFEATSLADNAPGVISDARGNYTTTVPAGWTLTGGGGLFAPTPATIAAAGHDGGNVAYLQGGGALSQTMPGVVLATGGHVSVTLNVGDRTDMAWTGGEARLVDSLGNVLATVVLTEPADGQWAGITLDSGPIPATSSGLGLRLEIVNTGANQILIDNVAARAFGPNEFTLDNIDIANIPNQSPDIGLSPGFNSWMTFFGQFFDHGLDLVTKGNGTVYIPLNPDDPLIKGDDGILGTADDLSPNLRFMAVSRAQVDANGNAMNTTTPFIDQNQTYTSHPSHHVFLREYAMGDAIDGKGLRPLSTGNLLDGQQPGTIATWADIKAQAASKLGILLNDFDVHNTPLLVTDEYGEFVRGPNGYPLMVMAPDATHPLTWTREGNPAAPITTAGAVLTGHQFLVDIAHHAGPGTVDPDHNPGTPDSRDQIADFDMIDANDDGISDEADVTALAGILTDANNDGQIDTLDLADVNLDGKIDAADFVADDHNRYTYDDEMLNAHYVTGDGRGNENIALTTVHSVFHAEHNRLVEENKLTILKSAATGDVTFLNEWLLVDVTEVPSDLSRLLWDGERMFQAARFVTEMQYQHLVFEEFARRIQPNVDPFVFTNTPDMDPSIIAEFAHTVYRFGHSMLTDTVDRLDNDLNAVGGDAQATLIEAFLNPQMFAASGANVSEIIANVVRGAVGDVGNEIDEFVVPALQSNLLGLPLDLAAINIARGRETGIKSLNEIRKELYHDYGLADLKPYTNWLDFAQHMKHPQSLVNFIAAYGTHATITGVDTIEAKRAAAWELITGKTLAGDTSTLATPDRLDFLQARGAYATTALGGMNNIDLWIGGLAEELNEFGGMLGSTFNFIFEYQLEHLQTGDRFYYLSRTQGTNLLNQLEPNTFTDLVMRNSDLSGPYATHLNGTLFTTPDYIFELDRMIAERHDVDPEHEDAFLQLIDPKVVRIQSGQVDANGHDVGGTLKFSGGEHVVLGGTEGKDSLYGDKGIDTLWGDGDDDYLNAGMESDNVFGGAGNDIIEDPFGDDVLRGGEGDDVISAGTGLDLIFGDEGSDFLIFGQDDKEGFGGEGNDFMLGGTGNELVQGGEGDDWLEGGDGFDTLAGDNSQLFFNSTIVGHDVMWGQGNDTDYDGESGDDIMLSGPGIQRFNGMFGFDWAIAKHDPAGVNFDFGIPIFVNDPGFILRDRFDLVEGGSGWKFDDVIAGDDRGNSQVDIGIDAAWEKHTLDRAGIDRIAGLAELLEVVGNASASFRDGNILLGGDGNDRLQGNGGFDVIDGDAWMNVRLAIGPDANGVEAPVTTAESLAELVPYMLNGTIKPGQISIVREILYDQNPGDNIDTAVYRGTRAEYQIEGADTMTIDGAVVNGIGLVYDANGDGFITIRDMDDGITGATVNGLVLNSRNLVVDDTDRLKNIERLEFADQTLDIGPATHVAFGTVTINDPTLFDDGTTLVVTPYVGQTLSATLTDAFDIDGLTLDAQGKPVGLTFEWQQQIENGNTGWQTIGTGLTHVVQPGTAGQIMRAVAVFQDATGVTERIASVQTDDVAFPLAVNENAIAGTIVALRVPFDTAAFGISPSDVSHAILPGQNAGGRFAIVQNGSDNTGAPQYSIVVASPTPVMDYELQDAYQTVDNQYQIVVQSIDTRDGTIIDTRQLTILLNDVAETNLPPSDLHLSVVDQPDATLPGIGLLGTLSATDDNHVSGFTYSLISGGPDFAVTSAGEVSRLNSPLAINSVYTIEVAVRAPDGLTRTETITIHTGSNLVNTITLTGANDQVAFGGLRNDVITGAAGDDVLFGQQGADRLFGGNGNDRISGGSGVDSIFGDAGNDVITGDLNNDVIFGGGGDDTIIWNALNGTAADGRDVIDGGDNGASGDTFVVKGRSDRVEIYRIYTVVEAIAAGATGLAPGTEIVITRGNGAVFNSRIIAELDNIEEIVVNMAAINPTGGGVVVNGSRVDVIGDFTTTSLRTSTIHIEGGAGADTVDFSALTSAHRIVFHSNGGVDTVIGEARQQDVIDVALTAPIDVEVVTNGTGGANVLTGDDRVDIMNGLGGDDVLTGGKGNDRISGASGNDRFIAGQGDGDDYYNGGSGTDTLDMSAITANITANLNGGSATRTNVFSAQTGDDTTVSIENIVTGSGDDTIIGGSAVNVIDGGAGSDIFKFGSAKAAHGDTLLSFQPGDRIDLSGFDANTGVRGVQQFTLVTDAITDRGQILVSTETRDDGTYTVVSGNVSGDLTPDFKIGIKGNHDLTLTDFTF